MLISMEHQCLQRADRSRDQTMHCWVPAFHAILQQSRSFLTNTLTLTRLCLWSLTLRWLCMIRPDSWCRRRGRTLLSPMNICHMGIRTLSFDMAHPPPLKNGVQLLNMRLILHIGPPRLRYKMSHGHALKEYPRDSEEDVSHANQHGNHPLSTLEWAAQVISTQVRYVDAKLEIWSSRYAGCDAFSIAFSNSKEVWCCRMSSVLPGKNGDASCGLDVCTCILFPGASKHLNLALRQWGYQT